MPAAWVNYRLSPWRGEPFKTASAAPATAGTAPPICKPLERPDGAEDGDPGEASPPPSHLQPEVNPTFSLPQDRDCVLPLHSWIDIIISLHKNPSYKHQNSHSKQTKWNFALVAKKFWNEAIFAQCFTLHTPSCSPWDTCIGDSRLGGVTAQGQAACSTPGAMG